jgi:TolB-like protein
MNRTPNLPQIRLLGGFELRSGDGRDVAPAGRKVRALAACLALSPGQPWPREKLMALLWSDRAEEQARASLRQALAELRRPFGEPSPLRTEHDAVSLDPAMIAVDAIAFERFAKAGKLDEAAGLYRGALLDGHGVREDAFEDWLRVERTRLNNLAIDVLDRFTASQSGDAVIETAQRLLQLDPAREETHRLLMRLYAAAGQRAQALRQYQHCRETLQRELQAKPDIETERLYRQIQDETMPALTTKADAAKLEPAPQLDSKPSIAVLPFTNVSGDAEQEYFSDGVTEDIISGLARLHWLFVIARNSSFTFKGKSVDMTQVGRRLGVRYLLEGSVRKAGDRVRITSQLIDAATGAHIWTDRFDGALNDIFDLQDRVAASVVGAIEPKLRHAEIERARAKPTESIDAYDLFLRALPHHDSYTFEGSREALRLLERAIEIDPDYASAYGLAACCYMRQRAAGWISYMSPMVAEGVRLARLAAKTGPDDPEALWRAGYALAILAGDFGDALALIERSLTLNPNSANAWMASGFVRAYSGESETAIAHSEQSARRSPLDPLAFLVWHAISFAHFAAGRYEEASVWADRTVREAPEFPGGLRHRASICGLLGQPEQGHKYVRRLLGVNPDVTLSSLRPFYQQIMRPADAEASLDGLRKAGLPK